MGIVSFIEAKNNPQNVSYGSIKEQYEKLFIKHIPEGYIQLFTYLDNNKKKK
jgi:hypothetical protein